MDIATPLVKTETTEDLILLEDPSYHDFSKDENLASKTTSKKNSIDCDASSTKPEVSEKVCQNIGTNWIKLHSFSISCKPLKEQFLSDYTKYLQIVKLLTMDYERLFIDIRSFNNYNIASRFGVTLHISEFRWLINKLFKCKPGIRQEGKRTLFLTKGEKFSYNTKLISLSKKSDLWINYGEIKALLNQYSEINKVIKEEVNNIKNEISGKFVVDEVDQEVNDLDKEVPMEID